MERASEIGLRRAIIVSPLTGAIIGLLAGLYPALRASSLEPAAALRR